ncbi:MAG: hypothetical protein HFJ85_03345 [Oscillospiraceae bacterium]|nr:hypothetical protein [Oscillospiraceae bacterium]
MAENNMMPDGCFDNGFKEAVCIETARIYDSCSAKDCFEDLQVYFPDSAQGIIDAAMSVKSKKASVLNVYMDVEPVAFNKGFYSVDVTFFFKVTVEAFTSPVCAPTEVTGLAVFTKKVILYGSEGNVATFSTDTTVVNQLDYCGNNLPTAGIQVVEPIFLSVKLCDRSEMCYEPCVSIPAAIAAQFDGDFGTVSPTKAVYVTLGLFSIVNLQRKVQLLVPVYDYCIPQKECCCSTDDPCEVFRGIKFPVDEFFPPRMCGADKPDCDC